jgi:hypothetical protein
LDGGHLFVHRLSPPPPRLLHRRTRTVLLDSRRL